MLWVGTSGGLDRVDPDQETFQHYRHVPGDPGSLSENAVQVVCIKTVQRCFVGWHRWRA